MLVGFGIAVSKNRGSCEPHCVWALTVVHTYDVRTTHYVVLAHRPRRILSLMVVRRPPRSRPEGTEAPPSIAMSKRDGPSGASTVDADATGMAERSGSLPMWASTAGAQVAGATYVCREVLRVAVCI